MAAAGQAVASSASLVIGIERAEPLRIAMVRPSYRLGRAHDNDICFANEAGLSREHLIFERRGAEWWVRDAGSANGTLLNGSPLLRSSPLHNGDRLTAGRLSISFFDGSTAPGHGEADPLRGDITTTDLQTALGQEITGPTHWLVVLEASRELVLHRPLPELFDVILKLAVRAAGASAAALLTYDGQHVTIRARHGAGLQISSTVVNRVLRERVSLLIKNTAQDEFASAQESIVLGQINSIVAVPLQTEQTLTGLIYADLRDSKAFTHTDLNALTVLANVAAVRIEQARLMELEQEQSLLARELHQAAEIQTSLLPGTPPVVPGFDIAGFNAPSRAVGGDYFDFIPLPCGKIYLIIADVAGKGMPAALLMSSLHARVGVIFDAAEELALRVGRLNRAVCRSMPAGRFITFFAGVLDPATGQLEYCNAGHNRPLIVRDGRPAEFLETTGIVLGVVAAAEYETRTCQLRERDALILYSDGVTETFAPGGDEEFGEERLIQSVRGWRLRGAADVIGHVRGKVSQFAHGQPSSDDFTLVVCKRDSNCGALAR